MDKKGKKKQTSTTIFIILIIGAALLYFTDAGEVVFSEPQYCEDVPYQEECYCDSGERKVDLSWSDKINYGCEVVEDLLLDPDSSTFQQDALAYVVDYLGVYCGQECGTLYCEDLELCYNIDGTENKYPNPDHPYCIDAIWGLNQDNNRVVNVECVYTKDFDVGGSCNTNADCGQWDICHENTCYRKTGGVIPWRMQFDIESDTGIPKTRSFMADSNYCYEQDAYLNGEEVINRCTAQTGCVGRTDCVELLPLEFS